MTNQTAKPDTTASLQQEDAGPPLFLLPLHGMSAPVTPVESSVQEVDALLKAVPGLSKVAGGPRQKDQARMRHAPAPPQRMR
jgi:hypothetical protein